MTALRLGLVTLYAFLVNLAMVLVAHTWSYVANRYFGTRITSMPAWFELEMSWLLLALTIAGAVASVLSCLGLAQRRSWARPLILTIAWLTLLFYVAPDVLIYVLAILVSQQDVSFFTMVSYKTVLLMLLSIASLAIWRSKAFAAGYASSGALSSYVP